MKRTLEKKLRDLAPDDLDEVEHFVDLLRRRRSHAMSKLSEAAFREVWDNPEDASYDGL